MHSCQIRWAAAAGFTIAGGASSRPLAAQAPAARLDTVTVVASRTHTADAARSVEVISRDQIARSTARTIADVLARVMSVDVYGRSPAQADVSIRGSSAEQVVVLVDGVRMSDVQSAHYALDLAVPLESVERIEVLRGAGSALYGPDAIGGVINIVTTRHAPASVRLRTGSFGTVGGAALAGGELGRSAFVTSADFEKSDGHRDGTDYRDGQARLSVSTPAGAGAVRSNLAIGVRDFGAADFYAPYNSIERTTTTTLDSRWSDAVGGWALETGASTRRHQDHYVLIRGNPSVYENHHESWQSGGDAVARRVAGPVSVAVGAEAVHDQLSSARLGGRREWRTGAFAEAAAGSASSAVLDIGARADHSSAYGAFFSPSMSAAAAPADWLRVRASGAVGSRAPTWTERYYVDPANRGDPDLRPERFWTGEIGARASAAAVSLDVAGFTRHATDLIDWVKPIGAPATAVWQTANVGEATYHGIEGTLALPSVARLSPALFATGLTLDSREGASLVGKYALRPVVRQAGVRAALARVHSVEASVDLLQERRAREAAYFTGSAHLAWSRGGYRVTLDATNLTNADWLDASGRPAAGRGVYAGIGWSP